MGIRPFLKTRYRVIPGRRDEGDHWLGGEPLQRGADCPTCKIPLLLIWDLNCRDPRFPRRKFGPLDRLPLYFCWGCVGDLAYQVVPRARLKVFRPEYRREGPNYEYEPYPKAFERRPIALDSSIPDEARAAYKSWDMDKDVFGKRLSARKRRVLAEYFGHPVPMPMCLFHSQLGGPPSSRHWGGDARCPNNQCPGSFLDRLKVGARQMGFLAGALNDPLRGLPMVEPPDEVKETHWNYFVGVEFQICGQCWTVLARNRCD